MRKIYCIAFLYLGMSLWHQRTWSLEAEYPDFQNEVKFAYHLEAIAPHQRTDFIDILKFTLADQLSIQENKNSPYVFQISIEKNVENIVAIVNLSYKGQLIRQAQAYLSDPSDIWAQFPYYTEQIFAPLLKNGNHSNRLWAQVAWVSLDKYMDNTIKSLGKTFQKGHFPQAYWWRNHEFLLLDGENIRNYFRNMQFLPSALFFYKMKHDFPSDFYTDHILLHPEKTLSAIESSKKEDSDDILHWYPSAKKEKQETVLVRRPTQEQVDRLTILLQHMQEIPFVSSKKGFFFFLSEISPESWHLLEQVFALAKEKNYFIKVFLDQKIHIHLIQEIAKAIQGKDYPVEWFPIEYEYSLHSVNSSKNTSVFYKAGYIEQVDPFIQDYRVFPISLKEKKEVIYYHELADYFSTFYQNDKVTDIQPRWDIVFRSLNKSLRSAPLVYFTVDDLFVSVPASLLETKNLTVGKKYVLGGFFFPERKKNLLIWASPWMSIRESFTGIPPILRKHPKDILRTSSLYLEKWYPHIPVYMEMTYLGKG